DEGVRLRAMAAADRRAGLRERALRNAGPDEKIVDVVGGHWTDLPGDVPDDGDERATLDALRAGATLVWGAALPADPVAGRAGMRCTLTSVPSGGYVRVLVVNHKVVDPRRRRASAPAVVIRLLVWAPAPDPGLRLGRRPPALDRRGHAWRPLEVTGVAAAVPSGAVRGVCSGSARGARWSTTSSARCRRPIARTSHGWRWPVEKSARHRAGSVSVAPARGGADGTPTGRR